jgi:hypothetical protein
VEARNVRKVAQLLFLQYDDEETVENEQDEEMEE